MSHNTQTCSLCQSGTLPQALKDWVMGPCKSGKTILSDDFTPRAVDQGPMAPPQQQQQATHLPAAFPPIPIDPGAPYQPMPMKQWRKGVTLSPNTALSPATPTPPSVTRENVKGIDYEFVVIANAAPAPALAKPMGCTCRTDDKTCNFSGEHHCICGSLTTGCKDRPGHSDFCRYKKESK